ncbi:hypothetical protein YC2023_064574 [Brassica napus]
MRTPNPTTNNGSFITVLGIDYTLVDHRSTTQNPLLLMHPCKQGCVDVIGVNGNCVDVDIRVGGGGQVSNG